MDKLIRRRSVVVLGAVGACSSLKAISQPVLPSYSISGPLRLSRHAHYADSNVAPNSDSFQGLVSLPSAEKLQLGGGDLIYSGSARPHSLMYEQNSCESIVFSVYGGERSDYDVRRNKPVDRSELILGNKNYRAKYGAEISWGFWLRALSLPEGPSRWCILAQLHQSAAHPVLGDGFNPPFCLAWNTESYGGLSILSRSARTATANRNGYVKPRLLFQDPSFKENVWIKLDFRLKFGAAGEAAATIFRNGLLVSHHFGSDFDMGYEWDAPSEYGVYPQFGIYRETINRPETTASTLMKMQFGKMYFTSR